MLEPDVTISWLLSSLLISYLRDHGYNKKAVAIKTVADVLVSELVTAREKAEKAARAATEGR